MGNNYAKAQSIYKVRQKHDKELSKILNAAKGEITCKGWGFIKISIGVWEGARHGDYGSFRFQMSH